MKIFLNGKKVKDLEEVISEQLKRMRGIEENIKKLFKKSKDLRQIWSNSL